MGAIVRCSASRTAFPRWSVGNDHLNDHYRAALRVACRSGRSASSLTMQRESRTAFPRWSVENDHLNDHYRAALRVACRSGRSASSLTTQSAAIAFPR
ncbi:Uncharacterized conserved protein [Pseudomonas syringae pv. actinidiae]|uniref:Uncharacterized conserved protein n=1 Tax=Pseudomonas syringae pv. actinidiae TaxID=103796 RepID=A0A2V0QU24_PSESF|nr:Uncharacterized conserved protein [Pseudomonas syringae pv. actinidiae]GBH19365.1 Uncharacterized conserved protein [Pseudomonas syringae pv. actinidiae]